MASRLLSATVASALALGALVATQVPAAALDASLPVALADVHKVLYDAPRHRILVTGDGALVALDATSGEEVARLGGLGESNDLLGAGDPDHVWLPLVLQDRVIEVDLETFTVSRSVATPEDSCPRLAVWALNRMWVEFGCTQTATLGSFDPSVATPVFETTRAADIELINPTALLAEPGGGRLYIDTSRYAMSGGKLVLAASSSVIEGALSWDPHGPVLLTDALTPLDVNTLVPTGPGPANPRWASGVVPSPTTDQLILEDFSAWTVVDADGSIVRRASTNDLQFERGSATWLPDGAAAFVGDSDHQGFLVLVPDAGLQPTTLALYDYGSAVPPGGTAQTEGRLIDWKGDPVAGVKIHISRTLNGGVTVLPDTTTAANGNFSFEDTLTGPETGQATYTATYPGSAKYAGDSAEVTVRFIGRPWDFNGDGFEDSAIGAPLEDVGSIRDAGSVTVVYGGSGGLAAQGAQVWSQDSSGVPGAAEKGDQFGYATTSGDYNLDGYADLAVGANNEAIGTNAHCGLVTTLFGSENGLVGKGAMNRGPDDGCGNNYFGESLATVTGQLWPGLAVGAPGEDAVYFWTDGNSGPQAPQYSEDTQGIPGTKNPGEQFGESLAAGDFNGDGVDDLVIGIPYDYDDRGYSSGAVVVTYGYQAPADRLKTQKFSLDTAGIVGAPHQFTKKNASDQFGAVLATGDLNGDGFDDLAVGAPGTDTPVGTSEAVDGGQVTVLLGSLDGLKVAPSNRITQETAGVVGVANKDDFFGATVAIGTDRPGAKASLFIGEPTIQAVHVLPGGAGAGALRLTQETAGIPGGTEAEDGFGWFIRVVHAKGLLAPADVLIGAPAENGSGALTIVPSTPTGATGLGATLWTQDTPDIPGAAEPADYWGWLGDSR